MHIYCKECPNLDFLRMSDWEDRPTCARTGKEIENIQSDYCDLDCIGKEKEE